MQKCTVAHDIESRIPPCGIPGGGSEFQVVPCSSITAGFWPAIPTAKQVDESTHETPFRKGFEASGLLAATAQELPFHSSISSPARWGGAEAPYPPTATQNDTDTHEMESRMAALETVGVDATLQKVPFQVSMNGLWPAEPKSKAPTASQK